MRRPAHPIDGRQQHPFVGREILQSTQTRAGSHDSDEIPRAYLVLQEFLQPSANRRHALGRSQQVADEQHDRAAHVLSFNEPRGLRWVCGVCILGLGRVCSPGCRRLRFPEADVIAVLKCLRLPVEKNAEVAGVQIWHRVALSVCHGGIHLYQVDGDTQAILLRRSLR